jgi:hypothetical protein
LTIVLAFSVRVSMALLPMECRTSPPWPSAAQGTNAPSDGWDGSASSWAAWLAVGNLTPAEDEEK